MQTQLVETLHKIGSVHAQRVRCGKPNCRCARGELHGPYFYHFFRENGRLRKRYLRPSEVDEVRAQCAARKQYRRALVASRRKAQTLLAYLRELEQQWSPSPS